MRERGLFDMSGLGRKISGIASLIGTTVLWGTSFSFIKLSVTDISPLLYTSTRTLIAVLILTPFILVKAGKKELSRSSLVNGFIVGITYALGLYLQAAGTVYTTPSLSAFITGLNTVHVHLYIALIERKYSILDAASLALAVSGLYVLTSPEGGLTMGVLLVFLGSIAWAAQILLISRYRTSSILEMLYGMFLPGALLYPLTLLRSETLSLEVFLYLVYLAVICSILATFLQVYGQRYVSPLTAALIFLLEPVFALFFSVLMNLEGLEWYKIVGGGLIVAGTYLASYTELKYASLRE